MKLFRLLLASFAVALAARPGQAADQFTSLYSFTGAPADAGAAYGPLVSAGRNLLLGTSYEGGSGSCSGGLLPGCGTIYQVRVQNSGGVWSATEKVVLNFRGGNDGAGPKGALVAGPGGVFYGTTSQGGRYGAGTVFSLTKIGARWTKTTLHAFDAQSDGGQPTGTLLVGSDGALYGTAGGGNAGNGVVFQLKPPATEGAIWKEKAIFAFPATYPNASANPSALIGDPATGFYGTTGYGGTGPCTIYNGGNPPIPSGCGTVYSLTQLSHDQWSETVLYNFAGGPDDGKNAGALVMGGNGVLYGTTYDGGRGPSSDCPFGCGIVYSLAQTGTPGVWAETVLSEFTRPQSGYANPIGVQYLSATQLLITTAPRDEDDFSTVLSLQPGSQADWVPHWSIGDALGTGETTPFLVPYRTGFLGVAAYGGAHGDGSVFVLTR